MREWIFGRNAVYETLRARRRTFFRFQIAENAQEKDTLKRILETCRQRKLPVERVPGKRLNTYGSGHQGVALQVSGYPYSSLDQILGLAKERKEPPFILILDTLQDPQNLGTLLRTAEAVGVHGVLLPLRHTVTVTPAVVNSSAGASEHLHITQVNLSQAIRNLKSSGMWILGLARDPQAQPPGKTRLDGALAIVVGNEGKGMRQLVRKSCDMLLQLPMHGNVESLNASVAGSITLYLAREQREKSNLRTGQT